MKKMLMAIPFFLVAFGCSEAKFDAKFDVENAYDFLDHAQNFKGKKVTVYGYSSAVFKFKGERSSNVTLPFNVIAKAGSSKIILDIPPSADVPQIEFGDSFNATFICKKGNLEYGNEVIKLVRK